MPPGLRQTTVGRKRVVVDQARSLESQSGVALGAITCQDLIVYHVMQVPGSTLMAMPNGITTRHTLPLDTQGIAAETTAPKIWID